MYFTKNELNLTVDKYLYYKKLYENYTIKVDTSNGKVFNWVYFDEAAPVKSKKKELEWE
jgi:hypothetical protein